MSILFRHLAGHLAANPKPPLSLGGCSIGVRYLHNLHSLEGCNAGLSHVHWQKRLQQFKFYCCIFVIHEGVDARLAVPNPQQSPIRPNGTVFTQNDEVLMQDLATCVRLVSAKFNNSNLVTLIGLLLACVFLLAGCGKQSVGSPIPDSPYKVIDTGYWNAEVNPLAEPLWLDNERIIFTSTESLTPGKGPYSVKVWNIKTGKIASTDLDSVRCARDGQVVYMKKGTSNNQWIYYRGPLENAKEHPAPNPDMKMDEVFDCDWVPKQTYGRPGLHTEGKFKLLGDDYIEILEPRTAWAEHEKKIRRQRGVKDTGGPGSVGKAVYHSMADKQREVPTLFWWHYSEFLDAYISSGYYDPEDTEAHSFWNLQRSGELKEIPYPKNMLVGRNDVYPLKGGYLVYYSDGSITETDNGNRGLYFINSNGVLQRLIIGEMAPGINSISPDGCKMAFNHANTIKENHSLTKPHRTIKYINFCQGGATP